MQRGALNWTLSSPEANRSSQVLLSIRLPRPTPLTLGRPSANFLLPPLLSHPLDLHGPAAFISFAHSSHNLLLQSGAHAGQDAESDPLGQSNRKRNVFEALSDPANKHVDFLRKPLRDRLHYLCVKICCWSWRRDPSK